MNGIIELCFSNSMWVNVVSFFLTVMSIVLSFFFYFKSKKVKKPVYMLRTVNLVRENVRKINTVDILYGGEKVDNLSITKIALWNEGRETVKGSDVAENSPIRLGIDGDCHFLDAEIIYQKKASNGFAVSISEDRKFVDIKFDYFDFEQGMVLQVLHTGNKSGDLTLFGEIMSVGKIRRKGRTASSVPASVDSFLTKMVVPKRQSRQTLGGMVLVVGLFFVAVALALPFIEIPLRETNPETDKWAGFVSFFVIGTLYALMGYRMIRRRIPKGFDIFNEEFLSEK